MLPVTNFIRLVHYLNLFVTGIMNLRIFYCHNFSFRKIAILILERLQRTAITFKVLWKVFVI